MRIFVGHEGMDFDSLAGMYAAKKLYGGGKICSIGKKRDNVKMFLKLYYKHFPIEKYSHIDKMSEIEEIIIVDTRRKDRLGRFYKILENTDARVIIYDHHPSGSLMGNENYVEQIGSVTTLIVEKLFDNNIPINSIEANLFLLGIYEDTGSLQYPNTTFRDVEVVARLLKKGGKLDIVTSYLKREFNELQKNLVTKLLNNLEKYKINDFEIAISKVELDEIVGGISDILQKIHYMENLKASFAIVGMGKKVHMVGKTSLNSLNISNIMSHFGGGGHIKAGSATIYNKNINQMEDELIELLENSVKPELIAEDIMSYPVFSLTEDLKIKEAVEKIKYVYYMNFPVINEQKNVVGWLPKEKIMKIYDRGDENIPIKGIMHHNVEFVDKKTPFLKLEETFLEGKVSIVVVGSENKLDGVVTPSDIINVLHAE